jgi:2-polyprenyl-3-methyl-5-hydroxy-6-metoxy-1,4-benzoquinol methylase
MGVNIKTVVRILKKLFWYPIKYMTVGGYNAAAYWNDRYAVHGITLRASGNEALSEHDNQEEYYRNTRQLTNHLRDIGLDLEGKRVLEIGCGSGVYTKLCKLLRVISYTGVDISRRAIEGVMFAVPEYNYHVADFTKGTGLLYGSYDIILCIDVIEHITSRKKFQGAIDNMRMLLADGGTLIIAPFTNKMNRWFYQRGWKIDDLLKHWNSNRITVTDFRYGKLLTIEK